MSMAEEPVLRAGAFNNSGGSVASAVVRSITDCYCLARSDRLREMQAIVVDRCMLHSPVGGPWEGLKAGVQGQVGFRRSSNRGYSHRCDDQPNTRHCHRNALQGKERGFHIKTKVPVVLLLISDRLG